MIRLLTAVCVALLATGDCFLVAALLRPAEVSLLSRSVDYKVGCVAGAPLGGVPYTVQLANGTQLAGTTDDAGKTRKITNSIADAVTLVIPEQTEVVSG